MGLPTLCTPEFFAGLEQLALAERRRRRARGGGFHSSRRRGHGLELGETRPYHDGDNPRHIDWSLYARTERLFVRSFQEERNLSLLILVDTSASMVTDTTKWERAQTVAVGCIYIGHLSRERVTLVAPPRDLQQAGATKAHFANLGSWFADVSATPPEDVFTNFTNYASQLELPSLALIVTDVTQPLEPLIGFLDILRRQAIDSVVVPIIGDADMRPFGAYERRKRSAVLRDSETNEVMSIEVNSNVIEAYDAAFAGHLEALIRLSASKGSTALPVYPGEDMLHFFTTTLRRSYILR